MEIFTEFGAIRHEDPASEEAQALVRKLQNFISAHFYTCTDQILSGLGQLYAAGGPIPARFAYARISASCISVITGSGRSP